MFPKTITWSCVVAKLYLYGLAQPVIPTLLGRISSVVSRVQAWDLPLCMWVYSGVWHFVYRPAKMFWSLFILWYMYVLFLFSSFYSTVSRCSISTLAVQKTAGARPPRIIQHLLSPCPKRLEQKISLGIAWLHQVPYSILLYYISANTRVGRLLPNW